MCNSKILELELVLKYDFTLFPLLCNQRTLKRYKQGILECLSSMFLLDFCDPFFKTLFITSETYWRKTFCLQHY